MTRKLKTGLLIAVVLTAPAIADNLYRPNDFRALTADRRAQHVGDILTVLVVENSSATATAGTKTDNVNQMGVHVTTPIRQKGFAVGADDNFDGSGKIARTGRLLAQLSVVVVNIQPNGDLQIKGEQLLEINGEKQMINLSGRVRPVDIGEGNTIPSNRLADARITYVGDGVLGDNQSKNWITRLFSSVFRLF